MNLLINKPQRRKPSCASLWDDVSQELSKLPRPSVQFVT